MNGELKGQGTKEEPFLVEDADDFYAVLKLNDNNTDLFDTLGRVYAKQVNDIDFNDKYPNSANQVVNRVGDSTYIRYDGCHHKIKNIKLINGGYFISIIGTLHFYNVEIINFEAINSEYFSIFYGNPQVSNGTTTIRLINCYIHGKVVCKSWDGITDECSNKTLIGCLIELNITLGLRNNTYIIDSGFGSTTLCDNIIRCKIVNTYDSTNFIALAGDGDDCNRCLIDNEYINCKKAYYINSEDANRTTLGTNIVNHTKGKLSGYEFDGVNILTEEQTRDLSYYEALGWWV